MPALLLLAAAAACGGGRADPSTTLTLVATTTIEDSGLLPVLVDAFRREHPELRLRALTAGTGEALAIGRRGDADVLLSHDSEAEAAFVAEGHGIERREVMYNDFVIAGPAADPGRIRGITDAARALARLAETRTPFISRGDDSGTHRRERALWRVVGLDPEPRRDAAWYLEAGVGMGEALRIASQRGAYIVTDRATFVTLGGDLRLDLLVEGDPRLLNRYGVTRTARGRNQPGARVFADWITGPEARAIIGDFGRERFGRALFTPAARP